MNKIVAKEACRKADEAIQNLLDVALDAIAEFEKGRGASALQVFKERYSTVEVNEAERFLDELSASIVLVGGTRLTENELANMTLGELLAMSVPNKINFRVWPSDSQFRK